MITLSTADMNLWIASLLWPLTRILGLLAAAPVFGHASVPITIKVMLGVLLALIVAPLVPAVPGTDPASLAGLLILVQELLIGLAMGFAIRIVLAAVEFAGEVSSLTMGLGFASFFDPATQGRSSAISQFLALIATLGFLAVNAHLVVLSALVESFSTLPVAAQPFSGALFKQLADWGAQVFATGLQLSLPLIAAQLITNVALGILTRAAPQLNIFGIGFPITLGVGLLVLALALPYLATPLQNLFLAGIEKARQLPRSGADLGRVPSLTPALRSKP